MTMQLKDYIILLILWFGFLCVYVCLGFYLFHFCCFDFIFNLMTSMSDLKKVLF